MTEFKSSGALQPVQMRRQMQQWLSTSEGRSAFQNLYDALDELPNSLVALGQSDFWRNYQAYLRTAHSRRKVVGELKVLLQEAGLECRTTNKGDWCGLSGRGESYWAVSFGTTAQFAPRKDSPMERDGMDNPWQRLGLEASEPSEVRAEIFRAFVLEKYGPGGEDNVEVSNAFMAESGFSFTEFFGGLSAKKIKLETWGEKHCVWVSYVDGGKAKTKAVPMHVHDNNVFCKMPKVGYRELVELACSKVPEKISFSDLAERFAVSRETVLRAYCSALSDALAGTKNEEIFASSEVRNHESVRKGIAHSVCGYFVRLGRAIIGRGGPSRSRYLRKWAHMLQGSTTQNAKLVLTDGRVVIGALLDATDDCFMMKVGPETDLIPVSEIRQVKGVDRGVSEPLKVRGEPLSNSIGAVDTGYVSWWGEDKGFGFIKAKTTTYYFDRSLVCSKGLLERLREGYRHQEVEFSIVGVAQGPLYARARIFNVLNDGAMVSLPSKQKAARIERKADENAYMASCWERDYINSILKTCDFHGLENLGVHTLDDLPGWGAQDHDQRFTELLSSHKSALESFWGDRTKDERIRYNDHSYNHEMIRFQLTGAGLLLWSGDEEKARTAWRLYLYRKLQEILLGDSANELEKITAYLVLIARTLTREDKYWCVAIPMLLIAVYRGMRRDEIRQIVEDDDFRNHMASAVRLNADGQDKELVALIVALGLNRQFEILSELIGTPALVRGVADYDDFRNRTMKKVMEDLSTLSTEGLQNISKYFAELKLPRVGSADYRAGLNAVVWAALDYSKAADYKEFARTHELVRAAVVSFEEKYVHGDLSLPVVDIYYPCACEILRRIDADFCGRSRQKVKLSLEHASDRKYYVDDGEVVLKLKLMSINRDAPSICDVNLNIENREQDDYFPGPLAGGEGHVFTVKLELDDEEVRRGEGSIRAYVNYKNADSDEEILRESFDVVYEVDEGVFEPVPNPYMNFVKKPATGSMFVGRERLLSEIEAIFGGDSGGQGYVLYGQRRTGKTSVYENVKGRLGDESFVYTKISLQALEEKLGLGSFSRALEDSVGNDLENGVLYVPDATVRADDYLGRIRAMSRAIASGKGPDGQRKWVVGIDEFTSIYDYYHGATGEERQLRKETVRTFLRELKALLEERIFNLLIIGQESVVQLQKDFPNEFAILRLHRLTYLREEDVRRLADHPIMKIRDNGERVSRFKGKALSRLFYLTAGQPWFTQMFCRALVDYLNENRLHDIVEDSIDAVERSLCEGDARIPDAEFESFVNLMADVDEEEVVRLYYQIAEQTEEEYDWVPLSDFPAEKLPIIQLLDARGILRVNKDQVQLRMGLFASWLRMNPGRTRISFGGKEISRED